MKEKKYFNWKEFFSYYKPFRGIFAADMFFAFLAAASTLVIPLIVRYITSTVVYLPKEQIPGKIMMLAAGMVGIVLVQCYSNYFIGNYGHVMGAKIEYNMRQEIFAHYQKLSFSFYDDQKVGQLMSRVTNDLFDITELLHHGPEDVVISIIKFAGTFTILLMLNWRLAVAAVILLPVMFVFAYILNKKMKRAFKRNREKIAEINASIEDSLSGIRVVKSFANERVEMEKFRVGNDGFLASKKNSYRYMGTYNAGLTAFITLITVVVVVAGALGLCRGQVPIPDLLTFLLYIVNFTEQFQNGITGYERFREIVSLEPEIQEAENPIVPDSLRGEVVFDDVGFRYEEGQSKVLSHVSLQVKEGEYVAIVGSSGAGKTTLCNLIPRFYEVTFGAVLVDGIDVRQYSLEGLRQNIGMVQQDVYLFAGTVFDNIRYGKPGATKEEVIEAAKNANAHDFIMGLPDGYDTNIGQRGVKLSGGQKQRLSIARVFLKNPPILIFDEATSALDNESEKVVQESLEKLAKNRTTFVIAHRLSTIQNAKRILVLTEDGIVEEGTHEELINKHGVYYQLYTYADC